ncbi:MAG: NADH-quinone oxidoreductase subunit L [Polyangiaceae bacterium]
MNPQPLLQAPPLALIALFGPALGALILAALPTLRARRAGAAGVTIASSLAALTAAAVLLSQQLSSNTARVFSTPWLLISGKPIAEVGVRLDGVSTSMLLAVAIVATCVQIFSIGYMAHEPPKAFGRYFAFHALFLFSMNVLVLAPDLMQLFAGWELVGVTSYLLIGFYFQKPSAARAAVKAFWVTKFADMGFVLALLVAYANTGSFRWDSALTPAVATAVSALLFVAVVGKSAQFPLHVWLPDAMEGPTPVSALLHAATMVAAGVYLIVRADPVFVQAPNTRTVMLLLGSATAVFAAVLATVQTDIKKVLAYSTCSQLGYMVSALGAGAVFGGYFHLVTHAFFKALLFLAAGSVIHAVHSNELSDMGGLAKKMPVTTLTFVVGALSLAGIPGLSGFFSKDLVLASVEGKAGWVPYVLLLGSALLTAFYMGRVVVLAFFGSPTEKASHAHESGLSMLGPLVVLFIPTLALGWFGTRLGELAGVEYHAHFAGPTPILASSAGLGGLALAWVVYGRKRDAAPPAFVVRLAESAAVNRVYEAGFRVSLRGADAIAWFDRYVIDGLMNGIGWSAVMAGRGLKRVQTGRAPDYVFAVLLGTVVLAAWGLMR